MIIIAEKLNGSIPSCAKAIAAKDAEYIKDIAKRQADVMDEDTCYIDVCASVKDGEVDVMKWMIDNVMEVCDTPICVDSPDPIACVEAAKYCMEKGMERGLINSVSGEGDKMDVIFPIVRDNPGWDVVALLSDDSGIPTTAERRIEVFHKIMEKAKEYGIKPSRIHIDPLVEMLCTADDGISLVIDVIRQIREEYEDIHITGAISNISFNLPSRKTLNQAFCALAMNAGLDSGVLDPLDRGLLGMIYATEAMLGLDDFCMEYISAYRNDYFGVQKK